MIITVELNGQIMGGYISTFQNVCAYQQNTFKLPFKSIISDINIELYSKKY